MGGVIRGDTDLDPVSDHDFNPMFFHSSGKHALNHDIVVARYFHGAATQNLGDLSL